MEQKSYVIIDEPGIHARPATALVQTASKFDPIFTRRMQKLIKTNHGCYEFSVGKDAKITIYADVTKQTQRHQ